MLLIAQTHARMGLSQTTRREHASQYAVWDTDCQPDSQPSMLQPVYQALVPMALKKQSSAEPAHSFANRRIFFIFPAHLGH